MKNDNKQFLPSTSAAVDVTSDPFYLDQMFGFAAQAVFTGTVAGTAKLQGSCDPGTNPIFGNAAGTGVSNWTDIANSSQAVSGAGSVTWNFSGAFYKWVRLVYTATSGTGNVSATINCKG